MPKTITVKAGDTLSKIARTHLGSAAKWSLIAEANGLADPNRLRVGQRLVIPAASTASVPAVRNPVAPPPGEAEEEEITFLEEGKAVYALPPGGEKALLGTRHRRGLYRHGRVDPEDFISRNRDRLAPLRLSDSEVNVLLATAENEGNLDAVNTWDNSFLSFGMFQWTAGPADRPGELPALLAAAKRIHPEAFAHYWGRFGLDVEDAEGATGWFRLGGRRLASGDEKEALRQNAWSYRFARAGADADVAAVQVLQAVRRLDSFFFDPQPRLDGHPLAAVVTSEYGAALLLDHHVNRPGHVVACVAQAIGEAGLDPEAAAGGGDREERGLLRAYLRIREGYGRVPMTNSAARAAVTRRHAREGTISEARGSFRSNRAGRA